ncbi:APC family permease [Limosilactobacillus sp.]|uniref:APC family permease n=1 Tax=Limosilactobacillus sp. TaxID=2773925 RepID=UPI003F02ACF1
MANDEKNDKPADDLEQFGYKQELSRKLTCKDLIFYGLIAMVPVAPFGIYGSVAVPAKGMVAMAYLVGMIAMFFTAVSYSQMSQAFPIAGSVYAYAQRGIGPTIGFMSGWMIMLDYIFIPALLYVLSANALKGLLPNISPIVWLVLFCVINTVINIRGIEFTARANKIFVIVQLITLAIFFACGIWGLCHGVGEGVTLKPFYNPQTFSMTAILSAVSIAVLSFLGFDGISTMAEETKGGNKVVGKAILWTLFLIGLLFVSQTYMAGLIHPNYKTLGDINTAFYRIAYQVGGQPLLILTTIITILALGLASALVMQAALARVLYSMARDKNMPTIFATIHPKYKTPYVSTLLVAGVSIVIGILFMNHSTTLSSVVNCGALFSFCVLHLAVINHYIRRQHSTDYLRHLVVPIIGFIIVFSVLLNLHPVAKVLGTGWFVIGLVYYLVIRKLLHHTKTH